MTAPFSSLTAYASARKPGLVDVFKFNVDRPRGRLLDVIQHMLSTEERAGAERMRDLDQRRQVVVRRAAFRVVVGAYLGLAPEAVRITRDERGKPSIATGRENTRLHVSCSGAGQQAVVAVCTEQQVGVDIEVADCTRFPDCIAELMLSRRERQEFLTVPRASRPEWLARVWTCKEAVLKLNGGGLEVDPVRIDVGGPVVPSSSPTRSGWHCAGGSEPWWVHQFFADGGVIAVATHGAQLPIRFARLTWN